MHKIINDDYFKNVAIASYSIVIVSSYMTFVYIKIMITMAKQPIIN